jgi:hypothetical protein
VLLQPGRVIPGTRYMLDRWLGEGSMGVVYEAHHVDVERRVAIKILNAEFCQSQYAVESFRQEAKASARIGAPNIVDIYDFAELPDGRVLMAMEYLEGESLLQLLGREPVEPGRLIGILRQVCKGLGAAHAAGIVHRDIKPENVMLIRRERRPDFVKILDFGVAQAVGSASKGRAAGTPLYMPPEVISGLPVDGRADMYSLGCTAYELLTRRPPFVSEKVDTLLAQHVSAEPTPISQIVGRSDQIEALERVIMRCLAKDPNDRYADMTDLEAALCEAQIAASLQSSWDDLVLPEVDADRRDKILRGMPDPALTRKRSMMLPALAAVSFATTLGLAALVAWRDEASPPVAAQSSLVDELVDATRETAAKAYYVYPALDDPEGATAYTLILELEQLEGAERAAATQVAGELRTEFADTLARLGDRYWERPGGRPFAIDYYAQALVFDPSHARARERATLTLGQLTTLRWKAETRTFSESELIAVERLSVLAENDDDARAERLERLRERELPLSATTQEQLERVAGGERPSRRHKAKAKPKADHEAAPVATPDAELPAAEPSPREASTKRDPQQAKALAKQARQLAQRGERAKAERLFHRALSFDPRSLGALSGLGDLYFEAADYSRSLEFRQRAAKRAPKSANAQIAVGDAYFKVLRYRDALTAYERAQSLGSTDAAVRIRKVRSKIGD